MGRVCAGGCVCVWGGIAVLGKRGWREYTGVWVWGRLRCINCGFWVWWFWRAGLGFMTPPRCVFGAQMCRGARVGSGRSGGQLQLGIELCCIAALGPHR